MQPDELDSLSNAGGDLDGNRALAAINTIRHAFGLEVIAGLRFEPCYHARFGCLDCALRSATGGSIHAESKDGHYVLEFGSPASAARAAAALQVEHDSESFCVPLPPELESLVIADAFDLTFRSRNGMLTGWTEPNDTNPHQWDLHLFPGREHPPGHEPPNG